MIAAPLMTDRELMRDGCAATSENQTLHSKLGWIETGDADGDREGGPA
ncbi:hypothetical protein [Nocardia sp. R6R-6]